MVGWAHRLMKGGAPDHRFDLPQNGRAMNETRRRQLDTYTKWAAGVVGTLLVLAATTLVSRDRQGIDERANRQERQLESVMQLVQAHEAQLQVTRTRQERVLQDIVEIKEQLKENSVKLDTLVVASKREQRR